MSLAGFTFSRAHALNPCLNFMKEMAEAVNRDILDSEDLRKIDDIFKNPKLSDELKAKSAFDVYFEARLRGLNPSIQEKVRNIINNKVLRKDRSLMGSVYSSRDQTITITSPLKYQNSVEAFHSLAHELEHAIIDQLHIEKFGKNSAVSWWHPRRGSLKYHGELAAMRAEWNYIRSVPDEHLQALINEIQNDSSFGYDKAFTIRCLKQASLDREAYIKAEHSAGRYTKSQLFIENLMVKSVGLTLYGTLNFIGGVLGTTAFCISKVKDTTFDQNVTWFQSICAPNTIVQIEIKKNQKIDYSKSRELNE